MKKIIYIGVVVALLAGFPAHANVSNEVSVSASTGSNGKSEAYIFIETAVDGEVVEHVEKHVVSEDTLTVRTYVSEVLNVAHSVMDDSASTVAARRTMPSANTTANASFRMKFT